MLGPNPEFLICKFSSYGDAAIQGVTVHYAY